MHIHWAAEGRAPGDCTDAHQWVLAHCVSCAGCDAQSACGAGGTGLGRKVRATSRLALTSARNVSIVSDVHGSVAGAAACAASCAQDFPDATELIEELFERWDRDGSGELSLEEFREGLQRDGAFLKSRARTSVRDILLEPVAGLLSRTWEGASAHAAALTGAVWDATMQRVACVGDGCRVAWRDGTRLVRSAPTAVGQAILNGEGRFVPWQSGDTVRRYEPVPLQLSSANEASYRCMLEMSSVQTVYLEAELLEGDAKEHLCSSGPISLRDEDWVCLSTTETASGDLFKLMSCMRDSPGWTFCFDVKERPDGTAILTHVRVVRTTSVTQRPRPAEECTRGHAADGPLHRLPEVLDCTEPEVEGSQRPAHRNLLRLYHQPTEEMLKAEFWEGLVQHQLKIGVDPMALPMQCPTPAVPKAHLQEMGYCRLPMSFSGMQDIVLAMERFQHLGFPPVFVFMFDEPWRMLRELFPLVATLLEKEEKDVQVSLSVFAWALRPSSADDAERDGRDAFAGDAFGQAHRDKSYREWMASPSARPLFRRPEANLIHWGARATAFVTEEVPAFGALATVPATELPRDVYNLFSRQLAVFVPNFWDSTKIEADIFLQRSFWLRNLTISPAAASLLTALAPPGLNFTRVFISDAKVSWNNLMALDSSPIVVEIDRISAEASELPADLIRQWLDVCGGVQPDPFTGRYPLLDAATFRVHHVDLTITSPARYGFLSVSLRGLEVKAVNKDGQQQDLLHMLERSQDWENNAITMSRLVECSQASARYLKSGVGLQDGHFSDYLLEPTPLSLLLQQVKNASYMRQIFKQRYTVSVPSGRLLLLGPLAGEQTEDLPDVPADPRLCPFDVPTPEWRIQMASRDQFDWIFSAWTLEAVGEVVGTAKRARPDGKISLNRGISSEKDQQKNKKKEV
eukprot:g6108.t2